MNSSAVNRKDANFNEKKLQELIARADARRMRGGGGGSVVGFNAQAAVDAKYKLIATGDVTNEETDVRQLAL